jgi:hypothetical protein
MSRLDEARKRFAVSPCNFAAANLLRATIAYHDDDEISSEELEGTLYDVVEYLEQPK